MRKTNTLLSYLKLICVKNKLFFTLLVTIAIVAAVTQVTITYKVKEIVDGIQKHVDLSHSMVLFIVYKSIEHILFFIYGLLEIKYIPLILAEAIMDIYQKTLHHSLHWFDAHLSGKISNKIIGFQDHLIRLIGTSFHVLLNIMKIIIGIFFLIKINMLSALVLVISIMMYTPVITLLLKRQMKLQGQRVEAQQETSGIINDGIANIFSIKIIGNMFMEFKTKLYPALVHWCDLDKKVRKFDVYFIDMADTIIVMIMHIMQIYLLAYLYHTDQITAGGFTFIVMTTLNLHYQLDNVLKNILFHMTPSLASMQASLSLVNNDKGVQDQVGARPITNVIGDIKFCNVFFAYDGAQKYVMHNCNLHIRPGQKVGIVGISGAGKTTMIKSLLRYFDINRGEILIDGQDIRHITQASLWEHIAIIPQDVSMFHRTILENLQIAKFDASFDEMVEACKKAKIDGDIIQMADGYHTIIGERGVKLSGGQRQRIAIARAILKNSPILILDEATSALDTETEQLIQQSLDTLLKVTNATTIVVAHRLSTLLYMDRILVLDAGQIIEDGTHLDLLNKQDGLYKKLWDLQVNGFIANT